MAHLLQRMEHRGACGEDPATGDGAGMLLGMPHAFLVRAARPRRGSAPTRVSLLLLPPYALSPYASIVVFTPPRAALPWW